MHHICVMVVSSISMHARVWINFKFILHRDGDFAAMGSFLHHFELYLHGVCIILSHLYVNFTPCSSPFASSFSHFTLCLSFLVSILS